MDWLRSLLQFSLLIWLCTIAGVSTPLAIAGAGRSYIFTGTGLGETQEIRTPVLEEFNDFSVSFWFRNIAPAAQPQSRHAGYPGAYFSYWAAIDGPSKGSGWALAPNELFPGWTPNLPLLNVIDYEIGRIRLFQVERQATTFHWDSRDDESWTFMALSWQKSTGLLSSYLQNQREGSWVSFNSTIPQHVNRSLPRGFFRIGQGEANDNTLAGEIDDFCVFNESLTSKAFAMVLQRGCRASEEALVLHYNFDHDKEDQSNGPRVFDSVQRAYTGVTSTSISNSNGGQILTDFGSDIGPILVVSDSPSPSGRPIFIRSTGVHPVRLRLECIGFCSYMRILSLPSRGTLCQSLPNSSNVCPLANAVAASDSFSNDTLTLYFIPKNVTEAGDRDGFRFSVHGLSASATSEGYVEILTNTPPEKFDLVVDMHEGEERSVYLPNQPWLFEEKDGKIYSVSVQILEIVAPESIEIYDCEECIDPSFEGREAYYYYYAEPSHWFEKYQALPLNKSEHNYWLQESLRRLIIVHRSGGAYGKNLGFVRFRYFDGFDFSPNCTLKLNVREVNQAPKAEDFNLTLLEDAEPTLVHLGDHFNDRENDEVYITIKSFPEGIKIFAIANDSPNIQPGNQLLPYSTVQTISQWVSANKVGAAKSCWSIYHCVDKLSGPPDLYPNAVDGAGTWSSSGDGHMSQWVEVFWDEPVIPTQVSVFETWSPGGVVRIFAKRFGDSNASWEVVYEGNSRMSEHCPEKPKTALCAGITTYQLCPKSYKTNNLRFELELDSPERFIAIDAILLEGETEHRKNVITDSLSRVFVQPEKDFHGASTIEFEVADCPYYLKVRNLPGPDSRRGQLSLLVTPTNDVPQFLPPDDELEFELDVDVTSGSEQSSTSIVLNLSSYVQDVDGDNVIIYVTSLPDARLGHLHLNLEQSAVLADDDLPVQLNTTLIFARSQCRDLQTHEASFYVRAQDSSGGVGTSKVSVEFDCGDLPLEYRLQLDESGSLESLAVALFVLGFITSSLALCFNVKYRTHPAVKMSSWRANVSTCAGSILVSASILFVAKTTGELESCAFLTTSEDPDLQCKNSTNACCQDYGLWICLPQIAFLSIGYTVAFGSLFLRTLRVHAIFNNKKLRRIHFTDSVLFKRLTLLVLVPLIFVGLWTFLYPIRGAFGKGSVQLDIEGQLRFITIEEACDSTNFGTISAAFHFFLLGLIAYGSFMAYQVREVKIVDANDSREIGISTYNICVLGTAGYLVKSFVTDAWISRFVAMMTIFLCNSTTIVCLFGPRIWRLFKQQPHSRISPTRSMEVHSSPQKKQTVGTRTDTALD